MGVESTPRVDACATLTRNVVDHGHSVPVYPARMKPIADVRRDRLLELIAEVAEGNASAFGRMFDKSRAQVGFWTAKPGKPGAKNISHATARAIERRFGKPDGWMDTPPAGFYMGEPARRIDVDAPPSQPARLDPARLGLALTSFDKALRDMEIQGQLGTLVEPLMYAYEKAFRVRDPNSDDDRALFDDLVAVHLRGWIDDRGRVAAPGEAEDRKAAPARKKAGRRAG